MQGIRDGYCRVSGDDVAAYIAQLIRNHFGDAGWKDHRKLNAAIAPIYTALARKPLGLKLMHLQRAGTKYPMVSNAWRNAYVRASKPLIVSRSQR